MDTARAHGLYLPRMLKSVINSQNDVALNDETESLHRDFKLATQRITSLLAAEGVYRKAYHQDLPYFGKVSLDQKRYIVRHLKFYAELCSAQVNEGYRLKDNLTFTWRALSKVRFCSPIGLVQSYH